MLTKLTKTNIIIHSFAIAHSLGVIICKLWLNINDSIVLTILTIAMILFIAKVYNYAMDIAAILCLLSCFAGYYLGTLGARQWSIIFPHSAHLSPVIITFMVTELLGWCTFAIVKKSTKIDSKSSAY